MENEIWKDIEGYECLYQVSDQGRVRSMLRKGTTGGILAPLVMSKGYLGVRLYKNKVGKTYKIHRLVAQAFIPNPDNKPQVNHKSEQKWLNSVDNLEWATAKENNNWGTRNQRVSCKNNWNSKPVKQLSLDGTLIAIWPSASEAERNGFIQSKISACCQGKSKTHRGYLWVYC